MELLPISLVVKGRRCVVVGGGEVATRKVEMLRKAQAHVEVISPDLGDDLARLALRGEIVCTCYALRARAARRCDPGDCRHRRPGSQRGGARRGRRPRHPGQRGRSTAAVHLRHARHHRPLADPDRHLHGRHLTGARAAAASAPGEPDPGRARPARGAGRAVPLAGEAAHRPARSRAGCSGSGSSAARCPSWPSPDRRSARARPSCRRSSAPSTSRRPRARSTWSARGRAIPICSPSGRCA